MRNVFQSHDHQQTSLSLDSVVLWLLLNEVCVLQSRAQLSIFKLVTENKRLHVNTSHLAITQIKLCACHCQQLLYVFTKYCSFTLQLCLFLCLITSDKPVSCLFSQPLSPLSPPFPFPPVSPRRLTIAVFLYVIQGYIPKSKWEMDTSEAKLGRYLFFNDDPVICLCHIEPSASLKCVLSVMQRDL